MRGLFAAGQQQMQHHLQYSGAARQHSIIRHNVVCKSSHQQSAPVTQQQQQQQQFVDLCLPPELQGFRPNVGMCVFHPQTHQVFAATRLDDPGKSWQMPQGGIDEGEAPQDAALRVRGVGTAVYCCCSSTTCSSSKRARAVKLQLLSSPPCSAVVLHPPTHPPMRAPCSLTHPRTPGAV